MAQKKKLIWKKLKDQWGILSILGTVIAFGFGGGYAWSEQEQKYKSLEQRVAQNEDTNNKLAGLADKLFDMTMTLWNIEPAMRKKWKAVPMAKPDSIICGYEWTEFRKLSHWVHYRYQCDSLGVPALQVDTLHVQKKKEGDDQ